MKIFARAVYPSLVGLMLGMLQTGLYFQMSFMLSSGFGTYLMVTLCWLVGSAVGVGYAAQLPVRTWVFLSLSLLAYGICSILLVAVPFNTGFIPVYALLIALAGIYPGVFFARSASIYRVSVLFFRENNGFILGLAFGTLLFMLLGRGALWLPPVLLAACLLVLGKPFFDGVSETNIVVE